MRAAWDVLGDCPVSKGRAVSLAVSRCSSVTVVTNVLSALKIDMTCLLTSPALFSFQWKDIAVLGLVLLSPGGDPAKVLKIMHAAVFMFY